MNRRGAGVFFCLIAALFFCCWNLSAAMFMGGGASWSMDLFAAGLEYTGIFLPAISVVNLIVGVIYLILAESAQIKEFIMKRKDSGR